MKYIRFIFALTICCFLTGCAVTTVDQMYQLPKRSDDYNNLQSAIDSAMNGLAYCAPLSGENRQTVQMCDLDGDEEQEYLLFAKGTQEKPLRILVFQEIDGVFYNIATVECNGSAFDQVEYIDMDGNGGAEIIVGRQLSNQLIRSVSVYTFQNGELKEMGSSNYTNFLTTDLDGNGKAELFVLRPGMTEADNGIAELYLNYSGGRAPHVTLNADTILYSTPYAMELRFTPKGNLLEKVTFSLKRADDHLTTYTYTLQELTADEPTSAYIDFNQLFEVNDDHAIYPISLETIKFTINTKADKQEYNIPIEGIYLHYKGLPSQTTDIDNLLQSETAEKVLHNGQLIIIKNNKTYNILGHEITKKY